MTIILTPHAILACGTLKQKQVSEKPVPLGADYGADLLVHHRAAVEVLRSVLEYLVEPAPADFAGSLVAVVT